MGCQSSVDIGDYLTFSICTHDPDTGELTDADALPTYRVYEDETAVPILTGTMAALDAVNTTGFYTERILCSAGNGFEHGKSYTIYIRATVDGDEGGICYGFRAIVPVEDAVWDEVLSTGSHDVLFSAGQRLRHLVLRSGTAIGGDVNYITLPGPWDATDGIYEENIISIVDGTGAGQTRLIVDYIGATRRAYVDRPWEIVPDATSIIELLPFSGIILADHGLAQGGAADAITLAATASVIDDTYIGSVVFISTGTGAGQIRLITAYDGTTKIATVSDDWKTNPDNTSIYKVLPVGRVIVDSLAEDAVSAIETGVWTYVPRTLTSASTAPGTGLEEQIWTVLRGDTLDRTFATIAADASITKCQLTVKLHPGPQPDTDAILAVDNVTGLIRLNGAAPGAYTATFTLPGGVLTVPAATMAQLGAPLRWVYDVQVWRGADVETIEIGRFVVVADVSRLVA